MKKFINFLIKYRYKISGWFFIAGLILLMVLCFGCVPFIKSVVYDVKTTDFKTDVEFLGYLTDYTPRVSKNYVEVREEEYMYDYYDHYENFAKDLFYLLKKYNEWCYNDSSLDGIIYWQTCDEYSGVFGFELTDLIDTVLCCYIDSFYKHRQPHLKNFIWWLENEYLK